MPKNNNHLDNIQLRSEEVQEILTKIPNWMIRQGNTLFLALILLLLLLSWVIKYPDVIISEAIITTELSPQKEFAKITGKLDTIFVKNYEKVEINEPIAIIENTANYNDVFYLKSIIDTIKLNKKTFNFPLEKIPILFLGSIESSFSTFENNYTKYDLNRKLKPYSATLDANRTSNSELLNRLQNLKNQKKMNKVELSLKKNDLNRSKNLFNQGVISKKDYEIKQLEYIQAKRNYQNMNSSISQLKEAIANSRKTIKGTEITSIRESINLLKTTIQSFNQLKKAIKDWEHQYVFTSRLKGKVTFLNYWVKNETVSQGDLVFTIIPYMNSSYIAKLKTPSLNSGKIKIGQKVNLKLQNYPDYEYGVLKGNIKSISEIPDKNGFYTVNVLLPKTLTTSYRKNIQFKQEMRATGEIITEDLRLFHRFFYQLKKVLSRKSDKKEKNQGNKR